MNLANKVTISRIVLVAVFIIVLAMGMRIANVEYGKYIAALIFIIAACTDGIDGYIARKRKQVTTLGKFLDPLADKLLVTAALIWLVEKGDILSWVAIIIIGREFIVTGLRLIAAGEGVVIAASVWGKLKTIVQIVAIVALLVHNLEPFRQFFEYTRLHTITMTLAVIITIYSGFDYVYRNRKVIKAAVK